MVTVFKFKPALSVRDALPHVKRRKAADIPAVQTLGA